MGVSNANKGSEMTEDEITQLMTEITDEYTALAIKIETLPPELRESVIRAIMGKLYLEDEQ